MSIASKVLVIGALGLGLVASANAVEKVSAQSDAQSRLAAFNTLIDQGEISLTVDHPSADAAHDFDKDFDKAGFDKGFDKDPVV